MAVVVLKGINATLAFLLELAMIASLGYWGYQSNDNVLLKWLLAIGLPLIAIVIWALYFAPKAARRLSIVPGALLSLGLFLLAALALYSTNQPAAAMVMAALAILNRILVLLWCQW